MARPPAGDVLERLFPGPCPPPTDGARLKRALETALAAQPAALRVLDVDALAAAAARAFDEDAAAVAKRPRASRRVPKEVVWHVLKFWRCDRDYAPRL